VYLVDTNVISATAPAKAGHDLTQWMDLNSDRLYISTITVAEIEDGIAKLRRERATRRAKALTAWLETLLHLYAERVLAFDIATARIAGAFSDLARSKGRPAGFPDIAIAATAKAHGLMLLTRNVKHFTPFGLAIHDPFSSLPRA
jgi:toxin FitB